MEEPLSISELTRRIRRQVESSFRRVCVVGEVSNLARASSGHLYLTLKDSGAQLNAVVWRTAAERVVFDLHDGLEVVAVGSISVYPPRGQYQLSIEQLQPRGVGALELRFRQLCEKLEREGLFDPRRKRALPRFPRRIGIVTSPAGAAVRDMVQILARRWPVASLLVIPVPVQGASAAPEIAAGVRRAGQVPGLDLIIVGRGGGSLEDLWGFNEECVARAIVACPVPVVSAVGHEVDVTISDLVADCRALTPSEAAERIVPAAPEIRDEIVRLTRRMTASLQSQAAVAREQLNALRQRPVLRSPETWLHDYARRLDESQLRLEKSATRQVERSRERLRSLAETLEALSPLRVLSRGYSLTRRLPGGEVIHEANQVQPGDVLETILSEGVVRSRVEPAGTA